MDGRDRFYIDKERCWGITRVAAGGSGGRGVATEEGSLFIEFLGRDLITCSGVYDLAILGAGLQPSSRRPTVTTFSPPPRYRPHPRGLHELYCPRLLRVSA